jgi:hypothetical protein
MKKELICTEKTFQGAWKVTILIDDLYYQTKQYMGYTKKEAVKMALS